MIPTGHPFSLVHGAIASIPAGKRVALSFSKYIHIGYGKTLSREMCTVTRKNFTEAWLFNQLQSLSEKQEMAFHSKVIVGDEVFHIPMVDCITADRGRAVNKITSVAVKYEMDCSFVASGNSYHVYFNRILDNKRWLEFLGSLLLLNLPPKFNEEDTVDARWIGHSLEHGFSALRWSINTKNYLMAPAIISGLSINHKNSTRDN